LDCAVPFTHKKQEEVYAPREDVEGQRDWWADQ
jgi:hypothetical protein